MIDWIKDSLAVALMVECCSTTTTTSAEPLLTSLLPWCWVVPRSIGEIIRSSEVFRIMTVLELSLIVSGFEISVEFLVTLVGFSRLSVRFSVVEVSFLLSVPVI